MNYIHKLKLDNLEQFDSILPLLEDKQVETIVYIGVITKPAQLDEQGNEIAPMEVVEGYHVDILAHEMIEELKPYCLEKAPENPIHGNGWAENDFIMVTK